MLANYELFVCATILGIVLLAAQPLSAQEKPAWPKSDPGPDSYATASYDWKDASRDRVVPVKIFYPKDLTQPAPVIVFSHGTGGSREGYAYLGRFWASHGYVSVHPQHAGSDAKAVVGSGTLLDGIKKAALNPQNAIDRPRDIRFVLDQLVRLNEEDATFKGKLNLDAVGLAGHSFGAHTTMVTAGQWMGGLKVADGRIKAIIPMSAAPPKANLDKAYADVKLPTMLMTGTLDDSPIGDTKAKDRRLVYDKLSGIDKWFINFAGGDHLIFSGRFTRPTDEERKKDQEFQRAIKQATLAFWDAFLKNDASARAWLTGNGLRDYLGKQASLEMKRAQ